MTSEEAMAERLRLWVALKPLLVRSLGYIGAAEWLEFAAAWMRAEERRRANAVTELRP